jgi:uncharacterized membrane protein (DUF2068 family)
MAQLSRRGDRLVVAIGAFKLVKCALLLALGLGWLFEVERGGTWISTAKWTGALAGHRAVQAVVARVAALDNQEARELALAALLYAAVFAVEGIGLILRKRWAEWLTVIVTGSFIPFEIYELVRHGGVGKVVALALNVAIVAYLAWVRLTAEVPRLSRYRPA